MTKRVTNTQIEMATSEAAQVSFLVEAARGRSPIEDSEERGQAELVATPVLPTELGHRETHADYERLGFVFGEVVKDDPLFRHVTLPPGWTKRAEADHARWSEVIDDKGRARVEVFYKAAFYDRKAHMNLARRYEIDRLGATFADGHRVVDRATGETLFTSQALEPLDNMAACDEWLDQHRPDHKSPRSWDGA